MAAATAAGATVSGSATAPGAASSSDTPAGAAQARIIKRYANRKLYDTRDSRYVTLPQVAEMVRSGEDVQIIDNRTKENLTSVTMAQIIYESEKSAEASSRQGVKTLRDFIQVGGEKLMANFREGPLGRLMPRASELPDLPELIDRKRNQVVAPALEALEDLQRRADERMRAVIGYVVAPMRELSAEITRLHARIEELESRLLRDKKPAPPPAPDGTKRPDAE
jgi:polyhydroxyalkanoate synthesis repressor PhaR